MTVLPVFIGYDAREHDAYEVCRDSILRRASKSVHITRLDEAALRHGGIYDRPYRVVGAQKIDQRDGKPFSTDFAFTRFLVPALTLFQGWALFCDCDFLFTADIAGLFDLADDRYAVMCVKHDHQPAETVKMDGQAQTSYRRKNWSSLVLFNNEHPANRGVIGREFVNHMPGGWLHAFSWLQGNLIGDLPLTWNWLSGVSAPLPDEAVPNGIHYTLGIPTMSGYEDSPYADLWRAERGSRRSHYTTRPAEIARGLAA